MLDTKKHSWRNISLYVLLIPAAFGVFWLIRSTGMTLTAPAPALGAEAFGSKLMSQAKVDVLSHVLIALAIIVLAARAAGWLFAKFRQPPVMGEVIAGIVLGPSLLGRLAPDALAWLLPPTVAPYLSIVAQVGVLLYMFLIGLELDPGLLRGKTHAAVAISHASIVLPFILGAGLALHLYPRFSTSDVPFEAFALFCGVAMSVTAFPVLARILTDRSLQRTKLGVIALSCAAVDDVSAWCLLAFVVSVVNSQMGNALLTIVLVGVYFGAMWVLVRPLVGRLAKWQEKQSESVSRTVLAAMFVLMLVSAVATELIGIHALFGAFLVGAFVPHDSELSRQMRTRIEDLVLVLFLPAFFAFTGLRTQIGLVSGAEDWATVGFIILVASIGKFGGTFLAARLSGERTRMAASLGVLMNTRGLMELIVLNIGLELGVLSPRLFTMFVIMAIATTVITTPVLDWLRRSGSGNDDFEPVTSPGLDAARIEGRKSV